MRVRTHDYTGMGGLPKNWYDYEVKNKNRNSLWNKNSERSSKIHFGSLPSSPQKQINNQ